MSRLVRRLDWLRPGLVDVLIAFAILVELQLEAWFDTGISGSQRWRAAVGVLFLVAPVLVRRRWPAGALVASAAIAGVLQTLPMGTAFSQMTGTVLPVIVLAFTAGAALDPRRGMAAVATAAALISGGAILSFAEPTKGPSLGSEVSAAVALPFSFWILGWLWQERSRRTAAFRDLLASVERERDRHEQAATTQERVRIGHELQDIIAQNISALIIQAGAARQLIDVDTDRAASAILAVERAGREALADLRRTLGLLRTDEDPRELAPQPGLAQLGSLLDSAREGGLRLGVRMSGEPYGLATGIDLVAYRAVEAALFASDGGRRPTDVIVGYDRSGVEIQIQGRGPVEGLYQQLHGISERVALYDGTLAIRPVSAGGYVVTVQLPRQVLSR